MRIRMLLFSDKLRYGTGLVLSALPDQRPGPAPLIDTTSFTGIPKKETVVEKKEKKAGGKAWLVNTLKKGFCRRPCDLFAVPFLVCILKKNFL